MSTLTGCSTKLMDAKIPNIGDLPFIHRINIQQGNVITQDMLAQLEPEMEKKKVLFILGTSVIKDTFNSRQWDYIYTYQIGGGEYVKRRITLHFDEKELLHSITGDVGLSDSPLVAKIHKDTKVSVPRYKDKPWKHDARCAAAMDSMMDRQIGKIVALLKELKIDDNTILFFTSDNGAAKRFDGIHNSSGKMQSFKRSLHEGGIRVPFVISWPERLPVGIKYNDPIISLDIFATCLAAAGQDIKNSDKLDGINLIPVLNKTNQQVLTRTLYWRVANGEEYAIRKGRYKLIKSAYKNKRMLFDLEKDQMETNDISKEMPAIVSELSEHYKNWNNELMPPLWDDPHMENVVLEETNTNKIRKNSLSKKEQMDCCHK